MKIDVVVVTYNRKQLLIECINAILNQTYKINKLFIIDNASTDGTKEELKNNKILDEESVNYIFLEKNIGGAGGFYEGMKAAREDNADWIWIMDDDTIPNKDCLKQLVDALSKIKGKISFLASAVYGQENECMNVPTISEYKGENGSLQWHQYAKEGIIGIDVATFVSILINGQATKEIGLPIKDYFIWGDDTEYTLRLTRKFGRAYLVGKSIAIHKRSGSKSLSIYEEENVNRIKLYYYMVRNNYVNTKTYYPKLKVSFYLSWKKKTIKLLFSKSKNKFLKIKMINKGLRDAIFKKFDYKSFKNRENS